MVPPKSTGKEVSLEWSHRRISSTCTKVRTTLRVTIIDSGVIVKNSSPPPTVGRQITNSLPTGH